jgi:antitoxin component YwqK of YwqJK toxin-antitoxin module
MLVGKYKVELEWRDDELNLQYTEYDENGQKISSRPVTNIGQTFYQGVINIAQEIKDNLELRMINLD